MTVGDTISVLGIVNLPFFYVYSLFEKLLQSTHTTGVYSAAVLVVLVIRFALWPIVGSLGPSSGSDGVDNRITKSTNTRAYPRDNSGSKSGG